jgi:hypothetical protein
MDAQRDGGIDEHLGDLVRRRQRDGITERRGELCFR